MGHGSHIILFSRYLFSRFLLQMFEKRIPNWNSIGHVGSLLGQLPNGSFSLVSLPRCNVRLRGRCDRPRSPNGWNVAAFQFIGHVHGRKRYTSKGARPALSFPSARALTLHISRTMPTMWSRNVGQRARSSNRMRGSRRYALSLFK